MTPELATLTRQENLLVLLTLPGEEVTRAGTLITQAGRQARTPLVVVLTDGSAPDGDQARAEAKAAAVREAARGLGVPEHRVFLLGLLEGQAPAAGTPLHAKLVAALIFLMWSRDCGVIVVARGRGDDHACAWSAAEAVAAESGVRLAALD